MALQFALNRLFVVTANMGSVFENSFIAENWLREFEKVVVQADPDLVALHCQEIGGKEFKTSMPKVEEFIRKLRGLSCFCYFDRVRGWFDTAFEDSEEFTALGSLYLVHKRVESVFLWDFNGRAFHEVQGEELLFTGLTGQYCPSFSKERFPNNFYPEVKWSRKGFVHSRWRMFGSHVLNFVNIHLFHDDDNLIALEKSPSVYSGYRRNAFECCLKSVNARLQTQEESLYMYGDFNFRLDFSAVVEHIVSSNHQAQFVKADNGSVNRIVYRNKDEALVTVERKRFAVSNESQFTERFAELLQYDIEPKAVDGMKELPVTFAPSYPFTEEIGDSERVYMDKRCPAWCDRIMMNESGLRVVKESPLGCMYNMMAKEVCVGDHKPIYLFFTIASTTPMNAPVKQFASSPPMNTAMSAPVKQLSDVNSDA